MITAEQQSQVKDISDEMLEKLIHQIIEKGTTKSVLKDAIFEATKRGYLSGLSFKSNREWRRKLEAVGVPHTSDYKMAKYATVGTELQCPGCGGAFIKNTTHHTFCQKKCKETYWQRLGDQNI